MTSPILEARRLCFGYTPESAVIRDFSIAVNPGTLCALIGINGSGKSTLVRLFAGILKPTAGEILINGSPLRSIPRIEAAKQIAYVPQSSAMVFPFTALEVVLTGRSPHRPSFRFEGERDREKALDALSTIGALHLAGRPITALSVGEQQLVSVARALAQKPTCLLLDEPSASLDLQHRAALMRTLVRLRDTHGLTVLVVTHDLHLINADFDRVLALRDGQVLADSRPEGVLAQAMLAEIYRDQSIRTRNVEGRTLVWCD